MSIAGDIGRNVRVYRRYFAGRDEEEVREAVRVPEVPPAEMYGEARLAGEAPAMAETDARLAGVPREAAAVAPFTLGTVGAVFGAAASSSSFDEGERAAERLLARLEREARLRAQDFGEE